MELWVREKEGNTFKLQGSLKNIYQTLSEKFTESPQILAFNGSKRERRRFKKELRAANRDLLKAAANYLSWLKKSKNFAF